MKKVLFFTFLLTILSTQSVISQTTVLTYGYTADSTSCPDCVFFRSQPYSATDQSDLVDAIKRAKNSTPQKKVIQFTGDINYYGTMNVRAAFASAQVSPNGFTFRGNGVSNTVINFHGVASTDNAIDVTGEAAQPIGIPLVGNVSGTLLNGSTVVRIFGSNGINAGDMVSLPITRTGVSVQWGLSNCTTESMVEVGQIFTVSFNMSAPGGMRRIGFTTGVSRDYLFSEGLVLKKFDNPIRNFKIENMKITRDNTGDWSGKGGGNIFISNAIDCRIINVESVNCTGAHVWLDAGSTKTTVLGCFFHDAANYGGGGHGYGVAIANGSCNNTVFDNVLVGLRHHLLVQWGANNNVFQDNFATDGRCDGLGCSIAFPANIEVHGNFPWNNTFVNNSVSGGVNENGRGGLVSCGVPVIGTAWEHGPNGLDGVGNSASTSTNSAFTNLAKTRFNNGIPISSFVNCNNNILAAQVSSSCTEIVRFGKSTFKMFATVNLKGGLPTHTYEWKDQTNNQILSTSQSLPTITRPNGVVPQVTLTITDNCNRQIITGTVPFACVPSSEFGSLAGNNNGGNNSISNSLYGEKLDCYPNPTTGEFNVNYEISEKQDIEVYVEDLTGRRININKPKSTLEAGSYSFPLNMSDNAKGIYFVRMKTENSIISKKIILF